MSSWAHHAFAFLLAGCVALSVVGLAMQSGQQSIAPPQPWTIQNHKDWVAISQPKRTFLINRGRVVAVEAYDPGAWWGYSGKDRWIVILQVQGQEYRMDCIDEAAQQEVIEAFFAGVELLGD